jgi:sorbitol-6-phosphate 2-dehydrogenase
MKLKDMVVAITGAAQGLGRALAQRCGEEGAKVVVGDLNLDGAEETASMLKDALAVKIDVTDYQGCEAFAQAAVDKYGRIDVLICNAAVLVSGPIEEFDPQKWKFVVDVNLCGFFNTVKAVVPIMRKQGKGSIVQINSKSGKKGSSKNSAYAASKFGGIGLVESLALELAEENIRVNAICPGNMLDSPLWVNSLMKQYARNKGVPESEIKQIYVNMVPMKRGCTYEDVANCMVFLACDDSSYMTGQGINVTGGQQMQP